MKRKQPTSVHIDPDLWEQVRKAAFEERVTHTQALEDGLRMWLTGVGRPANQTEESETLSKSERRAADKLLMVLRSGNQDAIKAVTANLNLFFDYIHLKGEGD